MSRQTPESQEATEDELTEDTESSEEEFETEDGNGQTPTSEKAKFTPFSAGVYRALAISILIGGGVGGYQVVKSQMNPDGRDAVTMTRDFMRNRSKMVKDQKSKDIMNSDATVESIAHNAVCLLNQMGNPLGDSYEPKNEKDPKKADYKRESNDFFIDMHDPKDPKKYVYRSNIRSYPYEKLPFLAESTINDLKKNKDTNDFLKWFTYDTKEFLDAPLACVRGFDGNCIKTWEDTDCLLLEPLADAVSRANLAMHDDGKGEIKPMLCYRNDLHQAIAFVGIGGKGCKVVGAHPGLMLPGSSFHTLGLAMDLANQGEAEAYLTEIGVACGFIRGDEGHCSFGEKSMNGNFARLKAKWQKWRSGWKHLKDGYKFWKKNR